MDKQIISAECADYLVWAEVPDEENVYGVKVYQRIGKFGHVNKLGTITHGFYFNTARNERNLSMPMDSITLSLVQDVVEQVGHEVDIKRFRWPS